ncbi:MAG: hypothetical protein LBP75_04940 [Planctomycetota bacterium]|jgi:hypothetical protein|nr:hypothetical protein [Planctomycetota bacterium]
MTGFNFSQLDDDEPPAAPAPRADAYRPIDQVVEDAGIDFEDDEDDASPAPEEKTPTADRAAIPPAPRASSAAEAELLDKFVTAYEQAHDPFLHAAAPPLATDARADETQVEDTRIDVPAPDAEPEPQSPAELAAEEPLAPRAAGASPSLVKKVVGWFKRLLTGNVVASNAVASNYVTSDASENDAVASDAVAEDGIAEDRSTKPATRTGGKNFSAVPFPPLYQEDGDDPDAPDATPLDATPLDAAPLDDARLDVARLDDNPDWLIPENELAAANDVLAALNRGVAAGSPAIAGQAATAADTANTVDNNFAAVADAVAPHYRDDLNDNLLDVPPDAPDILAETPRLPANRRVDDDEWQSVANRPQDDDDEWQTVANRPREDDDEWQTIDNRPQESNAADEWQTVDNRPRESNADDEWKTIVNSSAIIADDAWTDQMPPAEIDAAPVAASADFLNDEDAEEYAPPREEAADDLSAPPEKAETFAADDDMRPDVARLDVARPDAARPDAEPEDDWMTAVSADENNNDWFNDDAPAVSEVLPAVVAAADSSTDESADESAAPSLEKKEAASAMFDELPPPAADDEWGGGDWLAAIPADAAPAPKPKAAEAPPPAAEETDFAAALPAPLTALIGFFSRVKDAVVKPFAAIKARLANSLAVGRDALKKRREELEQLLDDAEIKEEKDENLPEAATTADWAMAGNFSDAGGDDADGGIEADNGESAEPINEASEPPVAAPPPEVEGAAADATSAANEASAASEPPAETGDHLTKIFGENAPAAPVIVPVTRWQRYYQTARNQALRLWQITDRRMRWRKNWWLYVDAAAAAVIIASTAVIFSYFLWG